MFEGPIWVAQSAVHGIIKDGSEVVQPNMKVFGNPWRWVGIFLVFDSWYHLCVTVTHSCQW
jgi:hypothetical protein